MDKDSKTAMEIVNSDKDSFDYSSCNDPDILLGREIAGCCNGSSGNTKFDYSGCTDPDILLGREIAESGNNSAGFDYSDCLDKDILIGKSIAGTLNLDNADNFSSFELINDEISKKGLYDWFEIFKAGSHTSNTMITKTYTNEDLDKIVSSTKLSGKNVPLVVGHVIINYPVYGYLADIKRDGSSIYAKCRDVVPQFEEFVKTSCKGLSASINPDMSLNHIAFLAVEDPAISLESINFSNYILELDDIEKIKQEANSNEDSLAMYKKIEKLVTLLEGFDDSSFKSNFQFVQKAINAVASSSKDKDVSMKLYGLWDRVQEQIDKRGVNHR